MLGIGAWKQRLPRAEDALPGRAEPMRLGNQHHVHGRPLRGAFAGLAQVHDITMLERRLVLQVDSAQK